MTERKEESDVSLVRLAQNDKCGHAFLLILAQVQQLAVL